MNAAHCIQAHGVSMKFPGRGNLLRDVDVAVRCGDAVAILGRNGAGKTTLLRILSGQILPTSGEVTVMGSSTRYEQARVRGKVGLSLYPERSFYYRLTVEQNLRYFQALSGFGGRDAKAERNRLLEEAGLTDVRRQRFMYISLGQRKRLGLARALIGDSPVIMLDEPFANLDEPGRELIARVVQDRAVRGRTTIFTTHDLMDVRYSISHVMTVSAGKVSMRASDLASSGVRTRSVTLALSRRQGADPTALLARWEGARAGSKLRLLVPVDVGLSSVVDAAENAGLVVESVRDDAWGEVV